MADEILKIKNWKEYQHYKDRNPPWVKLHRDLLASRCWVLGSDASKVLMIAIILLAARYDNQIPLDYEFLRETAHLDENPKKEVKWLIHMGFCVLANTSSLQANASAKRETEREGEKETEKKKPTPQKAAAVGGLVFPDWVPKEPFEAFEEMRRKMRRPMTDRAKKLVIEKLDALRKLGNDPGQMLNQSIERGWMTVFELKGGTPPARAPVQPEPKRTREQTWQEWLERAESLKVHYHNQPGKLQRFLEEEIVDYPPWLQAKAREYLGLTVETTLPEVSISVYK